MEPLKALTLLAAAGVVSLVGAGAAGFYAGYSIGSSASGDNVERVENSNTGGSASAVSLKPVLEDLRSLSRQVETLTNNVKAVAEAPHSDKPVIDEIRLVARQVEALKAGGTIAPKASGEASAASAPDYSEALDALRDQLQGLSAKLDKQDPKATRASIDELKQAVASLQNSEAKIPKSVIDDIKTMSASLRAQDARPQPSSADQIKILTASVENFRARIIDSLTEELRKLNTQLQTISDRVAAGGGGHSDGGVPSGDIAQIRQLLTTASDQFGRCQLQLASLSAGRPAQTPAGASPARQEPTAVVFYDNVMLRKDQEKQYDEIGVRLSLLAVAPKQVKLAVNRQGVGLAFGERKVFQSQDVECELNLMETNLNETQAKVSISCKR